MGDIMGMPVGLSFVGARLSDAELAVFNSWEKAKTQLVASWNFLSDPRNVQPRIDRLNRRIADELRKVSDKTSESGLQNVIRIVEAPWDQREKRSLAEWFDRYQSNDLSLAAFIKAILDAGVEPYIQPPLRPPIDASSVELVGWMAISPE